MLDPFRAQGYLRKVGDIVMWNSEFITSSEVCEYCCFSLSVLNRLGDQGILVPARVLPGSGKRLYALEDVKFYMASIRKEPEPPAQGEELMTSGQVCEYCCFSKSVLNRLEDHGLLVPAKVLPGNKKRLYSLADVKSYMDSIKRV